MEVTVHCYPRQGSSQHTEEYQFSGTFTAEQLTQHVARSLNITPRYCHLFSLAKVDLSVWLTPNALIESTGATRVEYVFRMRICPAKIEHLAQDEAAFAYFFLQCRNDFVNQRITCDKSPSESVWQSTLLGQGFIDALCYVLEMNVDLDNRAKLKPKWFLPVSIINKFQSYPKKRQLSKNMKKWLKEEVDRRKQESLNSIKLQYINGLFTNFDSYLVERFPVSVDGDNDYTVYMNVSHHQHSRLCIILSTEDNVKYQCTIDDLCGINVSVNSLTVEVLCDQVMPKLKFPSTPVLESFVSLLSKCYQLATNFHEPLCNDYCKSPMMEKLRTLRCHGPVHMGWAVRRLLEMHKEDHRYNYLLKQDCTDIRRYVLICILPENENTVKTFDIVCLPNDDLQLRMDGLDTPQFVDFATLLSYYNQNDHLGSPLKMCVLPQAPDDPHLLLCWRPSSPSSLAHEKLAAAAVVVKRIETTESLGKGHFTVVSKGRLPGIGFVAVKQLTDSNSEHLQKYLQTAIQSMIFWQNAHIIRVHAVVLAPQFHVVLEHAPFGPLDAYLRHHYDTLTVRDVIHVTEDLTKAVLYLEETGSGKEVHGNIRCRNMLVCSQRPERRLVVKLADPGLLHHYNKLPLQDDVNAERFPWIAPECYSTLERVTMYSDRYAFGITMWELFSSGSRPYDQLTVEQIRTFVHQRNHLDIPERCPPDIYRLMCQCWDLHPIERPTPRLILRNIISYTRTENNDEYLDQSLLPPGGDNSTGQSNVGTISMNQADMNNAPTTKLAGPSKAQTMCTSLGTVGIQSTSLTPTRAMPTGQANTVSVLHGLPKPVITSVHMSACQSNRGSMNASTIRKPLTDVNSPAELRPDQLEIDRDQHLGKGHYGDVYKGVLHCNGTTETVAVKCFCKKTYVRYLDDYKKEINIMEQLSHDNIVHFVGYLPQQNDGNHLQLVMEFVSNGCLSKYLRTHTVNIRQDRLLTFCEEIAVGMKYLHDKNIIHCDLAARNILVTSDLHLKICDFGMAQVLHRSETFYQASHNQDIPTNWCAPECLRHYKFSRQSDVWSYGITVWEIYSFGEKPSLKHDTFQEIVTVLHYGKRLMPPRFCPEAVFKLLYRCWAFQSEGRPQFDNIVDCIHNWQSKPHIYIWDVVAQWMKHQLADQRSAVRIHDNS